jgi:putative sigma-54 modulation protein
MLGDLFMQIHLLGKNFEVTPAIKSHTEEKLEALAKRFANLGSIHVVFHIENKAHIAEVTIHYNGSDIHATAEDEDMYKAIDQVASKLLTQLTKHKEKMIDSHR